MAVIPADMNTERLTDARAYVRRVLKITLAAGLFIGGVTTVVWSSQVGLGFCAGTAVGMINFQLMSVDAYEFAVNPPRKTRWFINGRLIVRLVIMFGFLALVVTRTNFNVVATFIGLFLVKIVLIGGLIVEGLSMSRKKSRG